MTEPAIDIIVPVWNRPVETRECIVNLAEHSPGARLILLNNGCDRETESLLEEFAEALDERALLIATEMNVGFVRGVNRGLARSEADFAAVVRPTSIVSAGWLEPLLELAGARPEAGVIVPRLVPANMSVKEQTQASPVSNRETARGDFHAMLIRRELFEKIGGFDEELDGAEWCLKDYSRRALKAGFLTFEAEGAPVRYSEDTPLGSPARREEALARSIATCRERWGEETAFCVHFPKGTEVSAVREGLDVMLAGARQGHTFSVLVPPSIYRKLLDDGCDRIHGSIRLEKLPRLFAEGAVRRMVASLRTMTPGLVPTSGCEGTPFPGADESMSLAALVRKIDTIDMEKYGSVSRTWKTDPEVSRAE